MIVGVGDEMGPFLLRLIRWQPDRERFDVGRRLGEGLRPSYTSEMSSMARVLILTAAIEAGACGTAPAHPTLAEQIPLLRASSANPEICEQAWGGAVQRRARMTSLPPRTAERTESDRLQFLADCWTLPEEVQQCLLPDPALGCDTNSALVELGEVFRRRCPGYSEFEVCLRSNCAWSKKEDVCVAP